jgi:hypothetical protein
MKRKEPESAQPKINRHSKLTDMQKAETEVPKAGNDVLCYCVKALKALKKKYEHENLLEATRIHVEFMLSLRQDRPKMLLSLDEGIESSIQEVYNHCAEEGAVDQETIWAWAERLLVKGESDGMTMKGLRSLLDDVRRELDIPNQGLCL